jgi:ATP-dependent DNA ligase
MGLEGIVSKRVLSPYKSGPSKFWLKTKNVVESELILLGTDYDNEGKPIAYLGREAEGQLQFAGTAFLTLSGRTRTELQARREAGCQPVSNSVAQVATTALGQARASGAGAPSRRWRYVTAR